MAGAVSRLPALFRMAVKSGSMPTVLLHIRRGLSVNSVGEGGRTPLMVAAAAGRLEICRLLLEEGADAAALDADGANATAIARRFGQNAVADLIAGYQAHVRVAALSPAPQGIPEPASEPPAPAVEMGGPEGVGEAQSSFDGASLDTLVEDDGWEADPEPGPPPTHDQGRVDVALTVQSAISARVAANTDADWSDVTLELPRMDVAVQQARKDVSVPAVRRLLLQAAVCGIVGSDQLARAAAAAGFTDEGSDRALFLDVVLEDLGCEVVDQQVDPWPARRLFKGEATVAARRQAQEAEDFLADLAATDPDLLQAHERALSKWRPLGKADQKGLWKSYRQGRRDLAFALSGAPGLLDELVARLDGLSLAEAGAIGQPPADAGHEVAEDSDIPEPRQSLDILDAQLARRLGLAVQSARADDNPGLALADQLAALDLPVHLIDQVRRALLLDPASASACAELSSAMRRIERARTALLEAHQRFVFWIARRYQNRGLDLLDLVQEGNIGLIKAIEKFDPGRGYAFTTYATWWVRQAITRSIADLGATIRIPVHRQETIARVIRAARAYQNQYGRDASVDELAELLSLAPGQVRMSLNLDFAIVPLSDPAADRWRPLNETLRDFVAASPDQSLIADELKRLSVLALATLKPREERVLRMRFGIGLKTDLTLEEIGEPMGVTRERIRQIESKALKKLKRPARSRALRTLLDS